MDKKQKARSVRLEPILDAKLVEAAKRQGRSAAGQIRFYVARGLHQDSFRLEDYCTTLEENGEEN